MSKSGLAKVSRRRYNLETIVFSAQQEVTVPAGIKIPMSTQYLLQPMLVIPKEKVAIQTGPGKVRVQGQIEGFQSCVDSQEEVHTYQVPSMDFMTSFTVPNAAATAELEAEVSLEGVEVDRGDGDIANITAYILVTLWAIKNEETELVTAVSGKSVSADSQAVKLQHIIRELEVEKSLSISLPLVPGKAVATDLCLGNLSWQVVEGRLAAEGVAMVKVFHLNGDAGEIGVAEGIKDFELDLDFGVAEISDCTLRCNPIKTKIIPGTDSQEFELVIRAKAAGYQEQAGEFVSSVLGADSLKRSVHLRNRIGESEFKLTLEGECKFPSTPTGINLALPKVRLLETNAMDEKVLVRGLLSLHLYYIDENEQKRVLVQEEEFTQTLDVKGCAGGYTVRAWAWPERAVYNTENYSVPVLLRVEVVETKEFEAVTDVHVVDPDFIPVNASVILYVAGKDESLFSVARKFNISQEMLLEYNNLPETEILKPGQKLLIPVYQLKYKG